MSRTRWFPQRSSRLAGSALVVLATVLATGCGSEAAKQCVTAGVGKVCAWSDGGVRLSTEGLEPGSSFRFEVRGSESGSTVSSPTLTVGSNGKVDGALGSISVTHIRSVVQVFATAAGGASLEGSVTVG